MKLYTLILLITIKLCSIFKDVSKSLDKELHKHGVVVYSVDDKGHVKEVDITPSEHTDGDNPVVHSPALRRHHFTAHYPIQRRRSTIERWKSFVSPEKKEPPRGIVVNCNNIECIFEFKVYEYCGRHHSDKMNSIPDDTDPCPQQAVEDSSLCVSPVHLSLAHCGDNTDNSDIGIESISNALTSSDIVSNEQVMNENN